MELSTYFRINEAGTGQFERTLLIADEGSQVSYLEGCTAPMRDENQLHAAVVELVALDDAEIDQLVDDAVTTTGAESMRDMGKVMGMLKPKVAGRTDMSALSAKIKARLG